MSIICETEQRPVELAEEPEVSSEHCNNSLVANDDKTLRVIMELYTYHCH